MEFLEFIKQIDKTSWIIISAVVFICGILYVKRSSDTVKTIVLNAINESEERFNSGEGQAKLDFAVETVRGGLPFILRIFMTKAMIISIIEGLLNTISFTFSLDKKVDIIGNDVFKGKKLKLDIEKDKGEIELGVSNKEIEPILSKDSDTELYANVKAETDWKKDTETSVEVGIKKKL